MRPGRSRRRGGDPSVSGALRSAAGTKGRAPEAIEDDHPGGNKTNIPLDGKTTTMGTATWSSLPSSQKIILHIADPTVCASLYGSGTSSTCFVKPSTGPICDQGDSTVAYNAMPFDVVNCLNPGVA